MSFINFTPHAIVVTTTGESTLSIEPSGLVLRVESNRGELSLIREGVVIYSPSRSGEVIGLDEAYKMCKEEEKLGIVSLAVANALEANAAGELEDFGYFVRPGTGPDDEAIRDERGHIVCVTRFIQVVN